MKLHEATKYRGFVICRGALTQGDSFVNPNRSAAGEYNQLFYVVAGCGLANDLPLEKGKLYDLSAFKDQEIVYTSTAPVSMWFAFNPFLPGTKLIVSILDQPTQMELLDGELETYIVPIKGSVEVNGKTIEELKSGRLLIGKEAKLIVPKGTICSIVKVVREVPQ